MPAGGNQKTSNPQPSVSKIERKQKINPGPNPSDLRSLAFMELDSTLSSLLRNLKVDDPWVPPKTWESIPSVSGSDRSRDPSQNPQISTNDLSPISESALVRVVINALQGLKSAIVQIDQLSVAFCSSPADRTFHQVPSLWCRSSSTIALGAMLKSIGHSSLVFFFLREFVNYYLYSSTVGDNGEGDNSEMKMRPPHSLVNQAFSVAVGKVLEGYVSALNTLLASVKLRRSVKHDGTGVLTSIDNSDITLLEVYLHSEELRTHIEATGNICFPKVADFTSLRKSLTAETAFEFQDFPRGAELLTYLYVLLRDADPGHHPVLKFLFVQSCEPYCAFIKSWIYHARIDDPYGEFFVVYSNISSDSTVITGSTNNFSLAPIKERDSTSVPCFLKDVRCPLIRTGQLLEVLVKLLSVSNFAVTEECESCNLADLEDILPFWVRTANSSTSSLNKLIFSRKGIQALLHKRENIYEAVLEKRQNFFTNLDVRYQRMHHTVIAFGSLLERRISVNSPFDLISNGEPKNTSIANEQGAFHEAAGLGDTDASTSYESLFDVEPSDSSDSPSSYSYEDEVESGAFSELPDISHESHQPSQFLFLNLHTCNDRKSTLQNTGSEKPNSFQHYLHNNCETMIPLVEGPCENGKQNHENWKFSQMSVALKSDVPTCFKLLETFDDRNLSGTCWPLGALSKNHFYGDLKFKVPNQRQFTEFCQQKADGRMETLEEEEADFSEMFVQFSSEFDAIGRSQMNSCHNYDLSVNPMLAKNAWLPTVRNVRYRGLISNDGPCFPYFNFSTVSDPCKGYSESMIASDYHDSQGKAPKFVGSASHMVGANENSGGSDQDNMTGQSALSSVYSSRERNNLLDVLPPGASGGSAWEGLLNYSGENVSFCDEDEWCDSAGTFDIPLDVIIDKCILQDILIQYKYVSDFAIKLLKEGFDLHEHLVAMRRYHFMEQADWADSFIVSLCNQKWSIIESEQKIAKIQGLLDLALQRSSCGNDPYRERLFVYAKGQNMTSEPTSGIGLHAFDFMVLGYRVDWPVNIIITQDALKIYANIFSYLIRVRLAVISLTDVWHWLKACICSTKQDQSTGSHKMDLTMLMKMRQQINHFVHTLQEYVHSHLSDVSWCQFQRSLQHRVKDMFDLESVHKSYLADALHICFLSAETNPVATIIKNILQCALDFRLCFPGTSLVDVQSDGKDPLNLRCQINFSQVFAIKTTFERNIRDLYILYLKSPKHGEFSICRFWSHLNYNDYYAVTIAKEMGVLYH